MPGIDQPQADLPEPMVGSYRLLDRLGSGGMSSVFRAVHVETGHEMAVKVLPRELARSSSLLQRFLREARSVASLEHPNIVAIYDRGFDQGRYYLVLEYLPDGDLHDRVQDRGPLPVSEAVAVIRSVAEGLRYAAGRGVIHRDVKPANLLMTSDGRVKITDLGLALQVEDVVDERVTRDGTTVGTVDYMAPEQARDSRAATVRSDIYSLGCTFIYLLTGSPPFPGGDVISKLHRHHSEAPPDVRGARPEIPRVLSELIGRMLAKRPEDRFQDYDQLIEGLDALPEAGQGGTSGPLVASIDEEDREPAFLAALIDEGDDEGRLSEIPLVGLADDSGQGGDPRDIPDSTGIRVEEFGSIEAEDTSRPWESDSSSPDTSTPTPLPPLGIDEPPESETVLAAGSRRHTRPRILAVAVGVLFVALVGLAMLMNLANNRTDDANALAGTDLESESILPGDADAVTVRREPRFPGQVAPRSPEPLVHERPVLAPVPVPDEKPEPTFPLDLEAQFTPAWATTPIPQRVEGPFITVRRVVETIDEARTSDLWRALERRGGTVELADEGPFFEDDFRVAGKERLIRARPGFRPIVKVNAPRREYAREQRGVVVLDGTRLILDGLDIVVNVRELSPNQAALFLCRGAELTLHNCTITVLNPTGLPFALVRTEAEGGASFQSSRDGRPSRIRVERSLLRGGSLIALDLAGGPDEVVVSRSALLCGTGSAISASGGQRVHSIGSLFASSRAIALVPGPSTSPDRAAVSITTLGTTFARLQGDPKASLIAISEVSAGDQGEAIDWRGDFNHFTGWPAWVSSGAGRVPRVVDLASARSSWPGTDDRSEESPAAWPEKFDPEWSDPDDLRPLAREQSATLARIASPRPYLRERTVGAFERQPDPVEGDAASASAWTELNFDARTPPWQGDLGLFIQARVKEEGKRFRIRARGSGRHALTPVRLPAGASLEILVEGPGPGTTDPLSWLCRDGAVGDAVVDVRGGDLSMSGVRLAIESTRGPKHLIRVLDGQLRLSRCWLRASIGEATLLSIRTERDRQSGGRTSRLVDCLLTSNGDAISAEVDGGILSLSNCAIASGGDAVSIRPKIGPPSLFLADLWLDRCTLVSDRNLIHLVSGSGAIPAPRRPWLVSTRGCAFLAAPGRGREAILLRADPEAMALGVMLWQGHGDAYEVTHFRAGGEDIAPADHRPDLRQQWIDFWGSTHMVGVTGPSLSGPKATVRLLVDRLTPGDATAGHLMLDPHYHPGRKELDVGAQLGFWESTPAGSVTSPSRRVRTPAGR